MRYKLIPRFHYIFRLIDILFAFKVIKKRKNATLDYFNAKELYHLNSARAGIFLLLKTMANGRPLKVGIQPYSCETVFIAIVKAGCIPVFIDIDCNFGFNHQILLEKADTIDVLIITHTFGIPMREIDKIKMVLKDKIIIEDCAHAFLSEYNDQPCGTFGDAAVFSLGYGKFPSIGHGGFVLINNPKIQIDFTNSYYRLKQPNCLSELKEVLTNYLFSFAFKPFVYGLITFTLFKNLDKKYDFIQKKSFTVSRGYRANQNVFYNNFERFKKINEKRRALARKFFLLLLKKPDFINVEENNNYLIPFLSPNRDIIYRNLQKAGFEAGKHFSKSIEWASDFGYIPNTCPFCEKIVKEIIVIPSLTNLKDKDIFSIVDILNKNT